MPSEPLKKPIAATIGRALYSAAVRDFGEHQNLVPEKFATAALTPTNSDIRQCVERICSTHPLTIVVDEFGKSLEYYASFGDEGDLFLLQDLAEMTQGERALPLVIADDAAPVFRGVPAARLHHAAARMGKGSGPISGYPFR